MNFPLPIKLRLYLKRSKTLYPILKNNLSSGGTVTTNSTQLCIEGYPSSANSYTYHLFRVLFPEIKLSHHTHSYANVSIALEQNIPSIVLLRNPLDCISSRHVRFHSSLSISLAEYIDFYSCTEKDVESPYLILIEFNEIINEPLKVLDQLSPILGVQIDSSLDIVEINTAVKERMKKAQTKMKSMQNISLPNEERSALKEKYKTELVNLDSYKKAEDLYRILAAKSILK